MRITKASFMALQQQLLVCQRGFIREKGFRLSKYVIFLCGFTRSCVPNIE